MRQTTVPAAVARAPMRTVRPEQLTGHWAMPRKELARLRRRGAALRLAHGYYMAVPDDVLRETWRPDLEAAAIAVATARFGDRVPVLMGIGAARFHRAIPRALGFTVVAVPTPARAIDLDDGAGRVEFVTRDTTALDARLEQFETGRALVATVEQTILDLAHRERWGGTEDLAAEAIRALWVRADPAHLEALAGEQRRTAALRRARAIALDLPERAGRP